MEQLSLLGKRWKVSDRGHLALSSDLPSEFAKRLMHERGLDALPSQDFDAREFLQFPAAQARIKRAIEQDEKIGIFGDYDCDGITSTVLLVRFFARRNRQPLVRLPHRLTEGYGLKDHIIDEFHKAGITFLITVDTGILAHEQIKRARGYGMDVLVIDHHHLPQSLPDAVAVLHPSLATPPIEPAPCAAGITWSLVRSLENEFGQYTWEDLATDCALACIGTVADLVELRGFNRSIVEQGLAAVIRLQTGPLARLIEQAGLGNKFIRSSDIAFRIAPRINAAGRMADPMIALHALLGDEQALLSLEVLNRERQEHVTGLMEDCAPEHSSSFLVLASADYSPGIVGLIAGKLTERFGRPSLVASVRGDACVASLRSIPAYHVTEGLGRCSDLLLDYGGHAQAAGCRFALSSLDALRERLCADLDDHVKEEELIPTLGVDAVLHPMHLSLNLCEKLSELEPFGQGNHEPRFLLEGVRLENLRSVGSTAKHLQATLYGHKLVGFHASHLLPSLHDPVDIVCRVGIDTWGGKRQVQLFLEDARIAREQAVAARM